MDAQPKRNVPKLQPGWWWIISGPVVFALIVALGALYFLSPQCVKRTDGQTCFDCLKDRMHETQYFYGESTGYWPWFSYYYAGHNSVYRGW